MYILLVMTIYLHVAGYNPLLAYCCLGPFTDVLERSVGDCQYLAQNNQAYSSHVGLVSICRLPTSERRTPIIYPQAEEASQPWLATHLVVGKFDFKHIAKGIDSTVPAW